MTKDKENLFEVGATVYYENGQKTSVRKVLKNGNVVLEDSTQQYGVYDGGKKLWPTGNSWSKNPVYADTETHREMFRDEAKVDAAKKSIRDEIGRLQAVKEHNALIEEAAAIAARTPHTER